jgi:hypothetical protein
MIDDSLTAVLQFLQLITEFKKELYEKLETTVSETVSTQPFLEVLGELDEIASHYSIDSLWLNDFKIRSIDGTYIFVEAEGTIDVVHQWGSNSDVSNGDGLEIEHSHPFKSNISFYCTDPTEWCADDSTFYVETRDWYAGDELQANHSASTARHGNMGKV